MLNPIQHQKLEDRLSHNVKWNPLLAHRLEEQGFVADSREEQSSFGEEYIGDLTNNQSY